MSDLRIPYQTLSDTIREILLEYAFTPDDAALCATLFAKASLDGFASHGLNRFPLFLKYIQEGYIDVNAKPERTDAFGSFERWDEKRDAIIQNLKSTSKFPGSEVRYPGEATHARRRENLEHGVPVDKDTWEHVLTLGPKRNT